jgi:hypothetical protein
MTAVQVPDGGHHALLRRPWQGRDFGWHGRAAAGEEFGEIQARAAVGRIEAGAPFCPAAFPLAQWT